MERSLHTSRQHLLEGAIAVFLDHYREHLLTHTRPYQGIEKALGDLRDSGAVMAVLTNKPEEMSRRILEGLGLMPFFIDVVGGDSLTTRKPDPAGVFQLCDKAGIAKNQSLMVGDSDVDVRTGHGAGTATCAVGWGFGGESVIDSNPDYFIRDPGELLDIVAGLTRDRPDGIAASRTNPRLSPIVRR